MKSLFILLVSMLTATCAFSQYVYVQYRQVPAEHEEKFVELETKYWSKVAASAIDDGDMMSWSLWRKVGVTEEGAPNYVFMNWFEDLDAFDNESLWSEHMDALGVHPDAVSTMDLSTVTFDYILQLENAVLGTNKYALVNYAAPESTGDFIEENNTLWKPIHEKNIADGNMGMVSWGMMSVIYPQGDEGRFSVLTWDGFNKMSDVLNYMRYYPGGEAEGPLAEAMEKTKMEEIVPDGFEYRIIYERVMAITSDNE